jgi:carbamate kinase
MSREQAEQHQRQDGWSVMADSGRGWRRGVASPAPRAILELEPVRRLLDAGCVVVAAGGGGIAVVEDAEGQLSGVAAIIDKDLASSLLAQQLGAEQLVIATAVPQVCLDFGRQSQRPLGGLTLAEAQGQFKAGSMGPKIQAAIAFLEAGGLEVVITDPEHLGAALGGRAGTRMIP